jgi:photosystem II stability/assembly factor-like uncharacterized protein
LFFFKNRRTTVIYFRTFPFLNRKGMKKLTGLLLLFITASSTAQKQKPAAPAPADNTDKVLYKNLKYRLIGPFRGGRSAAVAGSYKNKNLFYFGGTGGGVWKTMDGGSNWINISDKYFGGSIGAVAVAPSDETIIYAGEGEETMRGNVSEGLGGIWRSDDGGKSWKNIGLKDTRHIIRIAIHPKNPDIVWIAAMGHLFGPNEERGVFKTIDGGKTWKKVLYVNNQTGCSEVAMEPGNPMTLYAGTWRVIRTPHSMESGGDGSGLWKSTDGGETWKNISAARGLPKGVWGIVGVAVAPSNTDKLYALIENEKGGLFVSNDGGENWTLSCSDNNIRQRAWYYSRVYVDPKNENKVYCPNVGFMFSVDGGKTFKSVSTPHGDHHDLWIDPEDPNRMIVADDGGAQVSFDGAANWSTYLNQPTVQVYRLSTDNAFPYRILGGQQDNSAFRIRSRSYGSAITEDDFENAAGGESGFVVADPANPEITYGGSYMGYMARLDHRTNELRMINVWPDDGIGAGADVQKYRFQWNYPIFFSPHNPKRLYAAGNHLFATEDEGRSWTIISPDLTTNDKSRQAASGGPITKDNTGVEYYCTIFTATESEYEKDLLWTGSDDGLIYVSTDGGKNWENVTPKDCPKWMMWNCVEADPFKKGAAYFAGTRYKLDDFTPYIYKTEDYGKTWKRIDNGINTMHFTRAIRADRKRQGLLYAGTEYGMYISYDDGANWKSFQLNLPVLSVTDLALKENDLIVGTQGRSIYILDDLSVIQQAGNDITSKSMHVFSPAPAYRMPGGGRGFGGGGGVIRNAGMNPPNGIVIPFYLKDVTDSTKLNLVVLDKNKKEIKTFSTTSKDNKIEIKEGLNHFIWNMNYPDAERIPEGMILWNGNVNGPKSPPGNYFARFKMGKDSAEVSFTIKGDPNYKATQSEYEEQFDFLITVRDKFSEVIKALQNIKDLRRQMTEFREKWTVDSINKDVIAMMDSIGKKMTEVEEALHQTKAKSSQDVLNYPIRLDDKLSNIYGNAAAGYGALSKQSKEAYAAIGGQIDGQLNKLKNIVEVDIVKLNKMIREKTLPVIGLKKEEKKM